MTEGDVKALVDYVCARLNEDAVAAGRMDLYLNGHQHPYDMTNPCDPARVCNDILAKRAVVVAALGGDAGSVHAALMLAQVFRDRSDFDPGWLRS